MLEIVYIRNMNSGILFGQKVSDIFPSAFLYICVLYVLFTEVRFYFLSITGPL